MIFSKRESARSGAISDRIARIVIKGSAFLAILSLILIFVFIGKEALPIFTSAEIREEANIDILFMPQPAREGAATEHTWQPVSELPKYSLLPLLAGTLKVTIIAVLIAIPAGGPGSALYGRVCAPVGTRGCQAAIEILAGIPSVVVGFFCLMVLGRLAAKHFRLDISPECPDGRDRTESGGDPNCVYRVRRRFLICAADFQGRLDRDGRFILADCLTRGPSRRYAGSSGCLRARFRQGNRRDHDCTDGVGHGRNPILFSYGLHPHLFRHDCRGVGRGGCGESPLSRAVFHRSVSVPDHLRD